MKDFYKLIDVILKESDRQMWSLQELFEHFYNRVFPLTPEQKEKIYEYVKKSFMNIGFFEPNEQQEQICQDELRGSFPDNPNDGCKRKILLIFPNTLKKEHIFTYWMLYVREGRYEHTIRISSPNLPSATDTVTVYYSNISELLSKWKRVFEKEGVSKMLNHGISGDDIESISKI